MVNEKRLIDANELRTQFDDIPPYIGLAGNLVQQYIDNAPTVNAIELPCKIGDIVWGIKKFNHETKQVKQGIVHMMFFGEDMRLCICVKGVCRGEWCLPWRMG